MKGTNQSEPDVRLAPIRPELVAGKLASIRNYEYPELLEQVNAKPRLVELMWFIQAMSIRPGGLLKFTADLLAEFPERIIGTKSMRAIGAQGYNLERKLTILNELPDEFSYESLSKARDVAPWLTSDYWKDEFAIIDTKTRRELDAALKHLDAEWFHKTCRGYVQGELPQCLVALCVQKDRPLAAGHSWPLYFDDPIGALFEFMDRRATKVQKRLAMTEVAKLIFDRLDYALAEKVMVRIDGGSRFGKTESLDTWCDMRPGLARLVRVPCDNSMNSFFKRIGEALGIDCSYGSNTGRLKERIEYIVQHSGLFLCLDEGSFLVPQSYSQVTPPHRLNWVRTEIVDRKLPLAIACTPQSFKPAIDRFIKKTGYAMEQFLGREFLQCTLPKLLSEADMIAVARIHFPTMSESTLGLIANEARISENYLQAVEAIARRTRYLAERRNSQPSLCDVEMALPEVLPRTQPDAITPAPPVEAPNPDRAPARLPALERSLKTPLTAPARAVQPASKGENLSDRSLRAAGPGRNLAELVSANS